MPSTNWKMVLTRLSCSWHQNMVQFIMLWWHWQSKLKKVHIMVPSLQGLVNIGQWMDREWTGDPFNSGGSNGQLYSMQVDLESGKGFLGLKVHLDWTDLGAHYRYSRFMNNLWFMMWIYMIKALMLYVHNNQYRFAICFECTWNQSWVSNGI